MLCRVCIRGLDLDAASSEEGVLHHSSMGDLQVAAEYGCPVCIEIWKQVTEDEDDFNQYISEGSGIKFTLSDRNYLTWSLDPCGNGLHYNTPGLGSFYINYTDETIAKYLKCKLLDYPAGSEPFFELVDAWMKTCLEAHEACSKNDFSRLPTRVLDVGSENRDPFLFESKGACGTWMTLSYCWGDAPPFKTTSANIKDRCRNISFKRLPLLFRDAIQATRRLGYQYLWIDSLCIVQDSKEDWLRESRDMEYIFQRSALTLAAEAAMNSSFGLFQTTNEERYAGTSLPVYSRAKNLKGAICITSEIVDDPALSKGPLSRRAWTLQEDFLSRRVLHFAKVQVWWECREKIFTEIQPEGNYPLSSWNYDMHGPLSWAGLSKYDRWIALMNGFSKRKITYEEDVLPSITGIAKEFQVTLGDLPESYKAGLWLQDIHRSLLWSSYEPGARKRSCYVAPSWSWASINFTECRSDRPNNLSSEPGVIYHWNLMDSGSLSEDHIAEIKEIQICNNEGDPFGHVTSGHLKIYAPCSNVCSCNVPPCFLDCHEACDTNMISCQILNVYMDIEDEVNNVYFADKISSLRCKQNSGSSHESYKYLAFASPTPPLEMGTYVLILKPVEGRESFFERVGLATLWQGAFEDSSRERKQVKASELWEKETVTII